MIWSALAGFQFCVLNALLRVLTETLDPFVAQCLRYAAGFLVMWPLILRAGPAAYMPRRIGGQFARGLVHAFGLCLWFIALPRIPLADTTAIGFTGPIFMMIGAWLVFGEAMRRDRWLATAAGFAGVLIVVGPQLSGSGGVWHLVMLASCPVFAASFLITKALTRYESAGVIVVWQAITVTLFSLPLAWLNWSMPQPWQWLLFVLCGLLGSGGHFCLTRSLAVAPVSSTQSVKFLDLVWSTFMGWVLFAEPASATTLAGGAVISVATVWIARREARAVTRAKIGQ
ncbi:MAG: DMT family transporter [Burkholderiales bacterium]|nr:DMT family transporter [Burkholderiales bacterium]